MTQLAFDVVDVQPEPLGAVPILNFRLRIAETTGEAIHGMALRCQLRIEPQRRRYHDEEAQGLRDLFGAPEEWVANAKPFVWAHEATTVPGFTGSVDVDLPVTCTYDFTVLASKYLHALRDGEVPVVLLFNGTVFSRGATGFTVEPIPWDAEARWDLKVATWQELMDGHYPGSGWIRLHKDTIEALQRFKSRRGLPTWEETMDELLSAVGEPQS